MARAIDLNVVHLAELGTADDLLASGSPVYVMYHPGNPPVVVSEILSLVDVR